MFSFNKELHNLSFLALNIHNLKKYYKRCNEKLDIHDKLLVLYEKNTDPLDQKNL